MAMIKKTLITFLILFVGYCIFSNLYKPTYVEPQDLWQDSQMTAQGYLLTVPDTIENVIVGSSLSYVIDVDSLTSFCNLGLRGSQPYAGLDLIAKKGKYPKRVFIEINTLFMELAADNIFNDVLCNPLYYHSREHIVALRDGRQPILTLANAIQDPLLNKDSKSGYLYDQSYLFAKSIDVEDSLAVVQRVMAYNTEPPAESQEYGLTELKHYLELFKRHGTEVVFFEMPVCRVLRGQPRSVATRKILKEHFSPDEYTYLSNQVDKYPFKTYDTMHLDSIEAKVFTHYFRQEVDSLIKIGK